MSQTILKGASYAARLGETMNNATSDLQSHPLTSLSCVREWLVWDLEAGTLGSHAEAKPSWE